MSRNSVSLVTLFAAMFFIHLASPAPANAEPYPQINVFSATEDCELVSNNFLPDSLKKVGKNSQWIRKAKKRGHIQLCEWPVTALDKANTWLKEKGNSTVLISVQYHGQIVIIVWKDEPWVTKTDQ